MKIAIAGASGFIGRSLLPTLVRDDRVTEVVALSRHPQINQFGKKVTWREVDLADLEGVESKLNGVDTALYLVHSMSPQARLSQGDFQDFDLFQADNFARACATHGIRDIFYLGGIVQDDSRTNGHLSAHLRSRLEVERVLSAYGARVTALRAGLILGPGGSSSEMLIRLVRRLPFMFVPSWTSTESEPVDLGDVIKAICSVLFLKDLHGKVWELVGPERVTYSSLMHRAAQAMGLRRTIVPLPMISPTVSKLWVALISGAPRALVYPLVRSLTHPMLSRPDRRLIQQLQFTPTSLDQSLRASALPSLRPKDLKSRKASPQSHFQPKRTVRSIQRITELTPERLRGLGSLSDRYFQWLPQLLFGLLKIRKTSGPDQVRIQFCLRFTRLVLLELSARPSSKVDIERFAITRGLLQTPGSGGFLEFRVIPAESCGLSVVQDFVPRLPWQIYKWTQALAHLWVMKRFARYLRTEAFFKMSPPA